MITMKSLAMRQKYIDIGNKSGKAKRLEQTIREKEERITASQVHLVALIRDLDVTRAEYRLACIDSPGLAEIKGMEFDKLMEHPDIEDFSMDENHINVLTGPIYIEYHRKVYDIGKFKITLAINPRNFVVQMRNLTRSLYGTAHPHIYDNGSPCLGNIQECLPQMVAEYKFAAAISVCIQFLKSVHEDAGHYSKITDWPLKQAEEKRQDVKG